MLKKINFLLLFAFCIFILITKNAYALVIMFIGVILLSILHIFKLTREKNDLQKSNENLLMDITDRKMFEKKISKLLHLNQAMLEVSQSIIGINNINELFGLVLEKAIGIIENAKFGSVLLLDENNILRIVASKGFHMDAVNTVSIPLEQSFQWLETKGNIEKTVIINNIDELQNVNVVDIAKSKDAWEIKSCISAPIMIENKLYGMVNVDSNYVNAFSDEDLASMEHLRSQIEIAISKHKLYEETIYLSRYDELTNIYNRRYFDELFELHFNKALRYNEDFQLAIFDLNGLKIINDTYGHLAGDMYIKTFTNNLINNVRSSDILARYGGDEFIAVFLGTDFKKLTIKFEKLFETLKDNPFVFEGNKITCSFSYGIVSFPAEAQSYSQLVKIADNRMYEYKRYLKENQKKSHYN